MNIIEFMVKVFNDDLETYKRCLMKATIIVYKNNTLLVADEDHIYYVGIYKPEFGDAYRFHKEHRPLMKDKIFYSKDISRFKSQCIEIPTTVDYKGYRKYRWI